MRGLLLDLACEYNCGDLALSWPVTGNRCCSTVSLSQKHCHILRAPLSEVMRSCGGESCSAKPDLHRNGGSPSNARDGREGIQAEGVQAEVFETSNPYLQPNSLQP